MRRIVSFTWCGGVRREAIVVSIGLLGQLLGNGGLLFHCAQRNPERKHLTAPEEPGGTTRRNSFERT